MGPNSKIKSGETSPKTSGPLSLNRFEKTVKDASVRFIGKISIRSTVLGIERGNIAFILTLKFSFNIVKWEGAQ